MKPQVVSRSAAGTTAWIPVNFRTESGFGIGIGCIATGTLTYSVEHTFDDVFDPTVTPTAFAHSTIAAQTASKDGNYAFPVRAVRLNITAYTSGSVTMTLLQFGP